MASKVTTADHGASALVARLKALAASGMRVRVGVLDDGAKREPKPRAKGSKKARIRAKGAAKSRTQRLSLLEVAVVHEFGGGSVPQRSFIRATIDEKRAEIERLQQHLAMQVVEGKLSPEQALGVLGAKVAAWCKVRIAAGIAPALKPATVKRKGSSKPLIDTGQLRSSVTWRVEGG
jgi:hypothetical protein